MRFWLGGLAIVPAYCLLKTRIRSIPKSEKPPYTLLTATLTLGFLLFTGAALQQIGIIYTTAGKAGFITSLYIVFVPVVSLLFYNPLRLSHLFGCVVALIGVYFLSFHGGFDDANIGDILTLASVLFWTLHIVSVSRFVRYYDGVKLAIGQFFFCGLFNFLAMYPAGESLTVSLFLNALLPVLYCAIFSTGIAFTFQILGQKGVPPTEASLICSLEMVFGLIAGCLFLGETLTSSEILGAVLMSVGIVSAQLSSRVIYSRKAQRKYFIVPRQLDRVRLPLVYWYSINTVG